MTILGTNFRQWLTILVLAALALLLLARPAHGDAAAPSPWSPDRCVSLDIPWMSPPVVAPSTNLATSRLVDQALRLEAASYDQGASFTWRLRYPIEVARWPMLVLRYRALNLVPGPVYQDRILQLDLHDATAVRTGTAVTLDQMVADGTIREVRRDLSGLAPGTMVDAVRLTLHPAAGRTGQLDVVSVQFEQPNEAAQVRPLTQDRVSFVVRNAAGQPVSGAEVRVGILERANWTTLGLTGTDGKVTLMTTAAPGFGAAPVAPVEASVVQDGYLTEYVAPIQLPQAGELAVTLRSAATDETTPTPFTPTPTDQNPPPVSTVQTPPYDTGDYDRQTRWYPPAYDSGYYTAPYYGYGSGYYGSRYNCGWWIPWNCWPTYSAVVIVQPSHHGHHDGDRDHDRDGGPHGGGDARHDPGHWTAPGPAPRGHGGVIASPSPSRGTITSPSRGIVSAPSQGVITAPSRGAITAPSQGVITAPSQSRGDVAVPSRRAASGQRSTSVGAWSRGTTGIDARSTAPSTGSGGSPSVRQSGRVFSPGPSGQRSAPADIRGPSADFSRGSIASPSRGAVAAPSRTSIATPSRGSAGGSARGGGSGFSGGAGGHGGGGGGRR